MANRARSGTNELLAFNIEVKLATTALFFNTIDLPEASVSEAILNNLQEPDGPLSQTNRKFFQYMQVAECPVPEQSVTNDFIVFLLSLLDYDHDTRLLRTNDIMPFCMAGQRVDPKADVVLMDGNFLLVQEQERVADGDDPEPRLIAGCIMNNFRRSQSGLPPLGRQIIPGIIMFGTGPIFYRIIITAAFIDAVATSTYPAEPTIVLKCIPPVPSPVKYAWQGMRPLENRRVVFQCLEAFKAAI